MLIRQARAEGSKETVMTVAHANPRRVENAESSMMQSVAGFVIRWPIGLMALGVAWALGSIGAVVWAVFAFLE